VHIRAQNAALIVRRLAISDSIQFEVFEVSPPNTNVMMAEGKLLCSYPGPAIQVSESYFYGRMLSARTVLFPHPNGRRCLGFYPTTVKAATVDNEVHETVDPKYISELSVGTLRGYGHSAVVQ